jgi:hypothetical protein
MRSRSSSRRHQLVQLRPPQDNAARGLSADGLAARGPARLMESGNTVIVPISAAAFELA